MEQLQTGAIFSGPVWRLWMILSHPDLSESEVLYRKIGREKPYQPNNIVRPMGDHDLERI